MPPKRYKLLPICLLTRLLPVWDNDGMKTMVGERIKEIRQKRGYTIAGLAALLSVAANTVSRWETGVREPDFETIRTLATVLSTSVAYLLGEIDDPAPPAEWLNARPDPLKSSGRIISVPVYGHDAAACCGNGFGDMEGTAAEAVEYVDIPSGLISSLDTSRPPFIIYADGDSMADAGIMDGFQVLINPAAPVLDGDAALVDFAMTPVTHSVAIKRVYWLDGGAVEIRSACGDGWKRTFSRTDMEEKSLRIVGKVEWIIHKPRRG